MQLRKEILELAHELKLPGIVNCFDEVMQAATRNSWRPHQIVAELLRAESAEKTARSIRYQMGAAKFPISKSLSEFDFAASAVNEEMVRGLHDGDFLDRARNGVLVGGTGSGKTHLVTAIGVNAVNNRRRVRFFSAVDLVNKLEAEHRAGKAGRLSEQLIRIDLVVIDELGYLPFADAGGRLLFSSHQQALRTLIHPADNQPFLLRMAECVHRSQNDDRAIAVGSRLAPVPPHRSPHAR